jgi:hypothetical protein
MLNRMPPTDDAETDELDPIDREALTRAIEICRTKKSPVDRQQIERKLDSESWFQAAYFAVFSCQTDALSLRPWQPTPAQIDDLEGVLVSGDDNVGGHYAAARLLQRLLDAGLSRFEPDPINALKRKASG